MYLALSICYDYDCHSRLRKTREAKQVRLGKKRVVSKAFVSSSEDESGNVKVMHNASISSLLASISSSLMQYYVLFLVFCFLCLATTRGTC